MVAEEVESIAKRRGFFWPAAEIYKPIAGFWNWGPLGTRLKGNFLAEWKNIFVRGENAYEIETTDILPEIVWQASGHSEGFNDKQTMCKKCKSRFRADHFIEEFLKGKEKLEGKSCEELTAIIEKEKLRCPKCKGTLSEVFVFNLMFSVGVGPTGEQKAYLKPETTQSSVLDFPNVYRTMRGKLPLKIAQVGRSFRNEISPRNIMLRMREFDMAELQVFFNSEQKEFAGFENISKENIRILPAELRKGKEGKEVEVSIEGALKKGWVPNEITAYYLAKVFTFYLSLGFERKNLRFKELLPEERAHYAKVHWDFEVYTEDFGWVECVNNAWRTDYDLSRHQQFSKQKLTVFEDNKHVLPNMYEPSFGINRTLFLLLVSTYRKDEKRVWFAFPPALAPYSVAVFPLVKKDGVDKKAQEVFDLLSKEGLEVLYDESDSIGRRYARVDEIGIPFAVTVDYQTLEDKAVTVRFRDSTKQERVPIEGLGKFIKSAAKF
ncbi:MAG: glycine--tRNA ligase [Candidatus Aenigmarchaeota archaeon]|nr:glycine--tRNA ligase [Candidatus Aenigmarchaeota archaeon]